VQESEAVRMAGKRVGIDSFAAVLEQSLSDYGISTAANVKAAVTKAGKAVKDQIQSTAPRDTGRYAKSWSADTVKETASAKAVVVHSKKQYRLTHLLEFGHAKRGGGRTKAQPHIAPAEKAGFELLLSEVEKGVKG